MYGKRRKAEKNVSDVRIPAAAEPAKNTAVPAALRLRKPSKRHGQKQHTEKRKGGFRNEPEFSFFRNIRMILTYAGGIAFSARQGRRKNTVLGIDMQTAAE